MQVTIEKLVYEGAGLARTDQGVIFVPRTAPGDVVEIEITERKKDYGMGRVVSIVTPSPDRQEPTCPNYEQAGCCHWQHIRYDRQLAIKESILRESLSRVGKIAFDGPIKQISGPETGYRLRANFHVRDGQLGFVRDHSTAVVPIHECTALTPELNAFIEAANAVIGNPRFEHLNDVDVAGGATLSATLRFPEERGRDVPWEKMRDALFAIPNLGALTFLADGKRLHWENKPANIEIGGLKYGLSSETFFQANRFLLEPFVAEVLSQCGEAVHVLDLFCGSGLFSLPLARKCREVIGVESSRVAVKQAKENARANRIGNVEFVEGRVDAILAGAKVHPGLVVLDPPRTGAGVNVAGRIAELKAPRVVYVSCNPATFAREAAVFCGQGYQLKEITLVDQFPDTYHIELVARLERG